MTSPLCAQTGETGSWTQWRGANRQSRVDAKWPEKLDDSNFKQEWTAEFGPSYSGPIISGDLVFTTETKSKKYEVVTAINKKTGQTAWSTEWEGAMTVPFFAAKNGSWIRSTPATDGERVYVAGITGMFVCLDATNGDVVWKVDLNKRYKVSRESFGHVCSPLIIPGDMEPAIYIQCSAGFVKMNRETGAEIWRAALGSGNMMTGGAFSSPVLANLGGKKQLVIQSRTELAGIEPSNGKVIWRQKVPAFRGMNILTPSVVGDMVFTSSYNNKSFGYQVSTSGNNLSVAEKWDSKLRAYMSSPVVIDGHAYVHLQNKQLACFEVATGENKWVSQSRKRFGDYWSMIGTGDKILALDSRGVLYLIEANPNEFKLLSEKKLKTNDSWAHLAVDGNRVIVRGLKTLTSYQWK